MQVKYEFGATLYRTQTDMLAGIAYDFMTGQGWNSSEDIDGFLVGADFAAMADECIEGWGLNQPRDDDQPSHMEFNGYTKEDLAEAIKDFAETRPDRKKDEADDE